MKQAALVIATLLILGSLSPVIGEEAEDLDRAKQPLELRHACTGPPEPTRSTCSARVSPSTTAQQTGGASSATAT